MKVPVVRTKSGKEGADLNAVVREILRELLALRGWSENRAAQALGMTQRSLNRFLAGQHGLRLDQLSKICAELEINPVALLQSHELYAPETRGRLRFAKDAAYERFRSCLSNEEAARLTAGVEMLKQLGSFEAFMDSMVSAISVAKSSRRKALAEAHPRKSAT